MTTSCPTSAVVVGASGGIGGAMTRALAEHAAHAPIFALSRSGSSVPQGVRTLPIDLSDEATVAAAAARVGEAGPVGLVIVATGLLHRADVSPEKTVRALDPAAMATVFSVNTIGPALVAKHFVPLLARRGRCVFAALSARIGSIGDNRLGGWYAYRASKSALNQILRTLAIEVARSRPEAIVVGLHPGTVASGLSLPFRPDPTAEGVFSPEESAAHLLRVLNGLGADDTGGVFAWDGSQIPRLERIPVGGFAARPRSEVVRREEAMGRVRSYTVEDDGYRLSDALWAQMEPLLPPRPSHPLGCHNPPKPARQVMDAIVFVLRTGCQWNALSATGICSSSVAHRRFQEWTEAGVFEAFWQQGLLAYDGLDGIDWTWLALDGAMGKAPLGGGKNRPQPDRPGQARDQAQPAHRRPRHAAVRRRGRCQPQRPQADGRDASGDPGGTAPAHP